MPPSLQWWKLVFFTPDSWWAVKTQPASLVFAFSLSVYLSDVTYTSILPFQDLFFFSILLLHEIVILFYRR